MPNLNEFIGPKPTESVKEDLQIIVGTKPCAKCDADVEKAYWDPIKLVMTWDCPNGHANTVRVG